MAYPAASSTSWPTALDWAGRPGILARQPYHGCGSRPDSGSGSSGGVVSLYAPFLDPRGHQRACTGKSPVSSHTPTPVESLVKGDVKGRGDDDDKGGGGGGVQQTRHNIYGI